jgi:AraC-like DNA-binding protein
LLHDPSRRVTDVAFDAGFQSIPHFNHLFKRYTGLSPKGYRASLRQRKRNEQRIREGAKTRGNDTARVELRPES